MLQFPTLVAARAFTSAALVILQWKFSSSSSWRTAAQQFNSVLHSAVACPLLQSQQGVLTYTE